EESRRSRFAPPAHPILGASIGGPQPAWESRLDLKVQGFVQDHRVQQAIILPATAYLEAAFATGEHVRGETGFVLSDGKLANPCFLSSEKPIRLHTAFSADDSIVRIDSRPIDDAGGEWSPHISMTLRKGSASPPQPFDIESTRLRCLRKASADRCYEYFA